METGFDCLARPLDLPCGVTLKHRLAKPAMSDSLGDGRGDPTAAQARLYERWAGGGAALSIIGEVQTDPFALEKPGNLVLAADRDVRAYSDLAARGTVNGCQLWAQLGHAGALAHEPVGRPAGPSALDLPGLACAEMTPGEIDALPAQFATGATRARQSGFTGVQVHAAHGFLLSQFLSPLFNRRTDRRGGSLENRAGILLEVIEAVRQAVGDGFPVGLKLNASDMIEGGFTEADCEALLGMIDETSIDLVEISGGTYFPGARALSDSARGGPSLLGFARRARARTSKPLMAASGFKTRAQAIGAISDGDLDMVGLARPLVLDPGLPRKWLTPAGGDPAFPRFASPRPGAVTAWYTLRIAAIAGDAEDCFDIEANTALDAYDARDAERCPLWTGRFGKPPQR